MKKQEIEFINHTENSWRFKPSKLGVYRTLQEIKHLFKNVFKYDHEILEHSVIFKIPDVTVTDAWGGTTFCTDIYIKVDYNGDISMRRMSATPEQCVSGYCHSHSSGGTAGFSGFTSICFGGGNIRYDGKTFLEYLTMVVHYMPDFLSQESSHTNPYRLLSAIHAGLRSGEDTEFYHTRHEDIINCLSFSTIAENTVQKIKCKFNNNIDTVLLNLGYGHYFDGKRYAKSITILDHNFSGYNKLYLEFKNRKIYFILRQPEKPITEVVKAIPPNLKHRILKYYDSKINTAQFHKNLRDLYATPEEAEHHCSEISQDENENHRLL